MIRIPIVFPADGIPRVDLRGLEVWQQAEEQARHTEMGIREVEHGRDGDSASCWFLRHPSLVRLVKAVKQESHDRHKRITKSLIEQIAKACKEKWARARFVQ